MYILEFIKINRQTAVIRNNNEKWRLQKEQKKGTRSKIASMNKKISQQPEQQQQIDFKISRQARNQKSRSLI